MINTTAIPILAGPIATASNNSAATDDQVSDGNGIFICVGPSDEEFTFYLTFAWWLEGFGIILVGSLGILANAVAMPILLSTEMSSIFNRMLACLSVVDTIFIFCLSLIHISEPTRPY